MKRFALILLAVGFLCVLLAPMAEARIRPLRAVGRAVVRVVRAPVRGVRVIRARRAAAGRYVIGQRLVRVRQAAGACNGGTCQLN